MQIKIGLFIFDRGWIENKIIEITDESTIKSLASTDFFNGTVVRLYFDKECDIFQTSLIELKHFESVEEQELATIVISYLKERKLFKDDYVKFDITVNKNSKIYFAELN